MQLNSRALDFRFAVLLAGTLALRAFTISFPKDSVVFDESYYTQAGIDLLKGVASNLEHPFLGKLWGALGIVLLGNNSLGWRIPSVIFSTLTLIVFYNLATLIYTDGGLKNVQKYSLFAVSFLAFDNIFFVHGNLYVLEIPSLFFGLLGLYLYLKRRYALSSLSLALSVLSKETGLFFLLVVGALSLLKGGKHFLTPSRYFRPLISFVIVFSLTILSALWVYDLIYRPRGISNPLQNFQYIVNYQFSLKVGADADQNNFAWNWVLPLPVKEIPYFVTSGHPLIRWIGVGNLPLWTIGFWLVTIFTVAKLLANRREDIGRPTSLIFAWIVGTYLPYIYLSLVVQRIVYPFYFINTVPAIALGVPYTVSRLFPSNARASNLILIVFLSATVLWFLYYFPIIP